GHDPLRLRAVSVASKDQRMRGRKFAPSFAGARFFRIRPAVRLRHGATWPKGPSANGWLRIAQAAVLSRIQTTRFPALVFEAGSVQWPIHQLTVPVRIAPSPAR